MFSKNESLHKKADLLVEYPLKIRIELAKHLQTFCGQFLMFAGWRVPLANSLLLYGIVAF